LSRGAPAPHYEMAPEHTLRLAGAVAATAVVAAPVAISAESASRIIDRTVVCSMSGAGYPDPSRFISVSADPFLAASEASPSVYLANGPIDATHPHVRMRTGAWGHGNPTLTRGELALTQPPCKATKRHVSLATSARKARPTEPFGEFWRCQVPAKVLLRVRAVFKRPTRLTRRPGYPWILVWKGDIATGSVAVTTLAGRRLIFFASVNDATGKARIFVPSGCSRSR
jgi:hypothetical protein